MQKQATRIPLGLLGLLGGLLVFMCPGSPFSSGGNATPDADDGAARASRYV